MTCADPMLSRFMITDNSIAPASPEYIRFAATKTFGSLDGLRALSILAVLWHHHADNIIPGWTISARGFLGVDLFFTISGFLIVTLLLREQRSTGTLSLRDFYVRRFLRILPPYYLLLLLVGVVAFLRPDGNTSNDVKHDLPYAIFFISNLVAMQSLLAITWSLSVEEQFYALVPAIEKYLSRALPILFPLVYVAVSLPAFGIIPLSFPAFFRETTFGPILLGAMLAHVLHNPSSFSWAWKLAGARFAPLIALGVIFASASYPSEEFVGLPRIITHWAMVALLASCVVRENNCLAPLLSFWPARRVGAVSYGMYLYHLIVMHFVVRGLGTAGLMTFFLTALGSWMIAELSYHLFESRFLALKTRFSPGARKTAAADPTGVTGARPNSSGH